MHSPGWRIEQALAASLACPFRGTVWRVHWREIAPMDWSLSLRSTGRYHRGLDLFPEDQAFPALYTSLAPEIAIWEMVRRSAARNLQYLQNNILSELEVDLRNALDLSDPTIVDRTPAALTGSDPQQCQELAAAAMVQGFEGLLVPSAALPGRNLVILPLNIAEPPPIRVVRSTELPLKSITQEQKDDAGTETTSGRVGAA